MDETTTQLEARLANVEDRLRQQTRITSTLQAWARRQQNPGQEVLVEINIADFHCWLTTDECNAWNEHATTLAVDRDYANNRIDIELLRLRLPAEPNGSERDRLAECLSQALHKEVGLRVLLSQEAKQWYAGILTQRQARGPLGALGQDFRQIRKDADQAQEELEAGEEIRREEERDDIRRELAAEDAPDEELDDIRREENPRRSLSKDEMIEIEQEYGYDPSDCGASTEGPDA